jgi:uncharacterized protein YbbC (DUF1343 family)
LSERLELIAGKSIGFVTNHTALLNDGTHIIDSLIKNENTEIVALFGPEHGIRGERADGVIVDNLSDSLTGLPVYSLYGKVRKPTPEMLEGINLLVFDIQDIGARFYTYISTMYNVISAAAENGIPILILDRPNPIGGVMVDGPIVKEELRSFVGKIPIPIQHGMTIGELALMINYEGLLENGLKADLKVVKMENWKRDYYFDDTDLIWIKPSPNMVSLNTALLYPGLCLLEGTNVSEGRGTDDPFVIFGAPFINSGDLIDQLVSFNIPGITFEKTEFTPREIPGMAKNPKFEGIPCDGIKLSVTDRKSFKPVEFGVYLIYSLNKLYAADFSFKDKRIDKLFGDSYLRTDIIAGKKPEEIITGWRSDIDSFESIRNKYLLY